MIRARDGADVRFDYAMTKVGANWLVHDVVVDGVSLIENYRAQIAHVLRASSYAGLVARLRSEAAAGEPTPYPPVQHAAPQNAEMP
jgi:ABC-type transporter MlaC component